MSIARLLISKHLTLNSKPHLRSNTVSSSRLEQNFVSIHSLMHRACLKDVVLPFKDAR